MKKTSILFFFVVSFVKTFSQQVTFQKIYSGDSLIGLSAHYEIIQTPDFGYLAGNSELILKTDSLGQRQWEKEYSGFFRSYSIARTYDNNYVTAGGSLLTKFDSALSVIWCRQLNISMGLAFYTIIQTPDSGFLLGGSRVLGLESRPLLIKTDSTGNIQWAKVYDTPRAVDFRFLTRAQDGGFVLVGVNATPSNPFLCDNIVFKIDSAGNSQWAKRYASPAMTQSMASHITSTYDGGFVICGIRNLHRMLLKIDSVGNIVWQKYYESETGGDARWIEETTDHGLITTGMLSQTGMLLKTDSAGNVSWARKLGTFLGPWAVCVKQTHDDGFVIGTRAGWSGIIDAFGIIKTDSLGHTGGCLEATPVFTVTNLNDSIVIEPVTDSILNITASLITITDSIVGAEHVICAPNSTVNLNDNNTTVAISPIPATTHITLQYHLTQNATLQIHDITGRRVQQTTLTKTSTTATIDVRTLPAGMYFYTLQSTNGQAKTGKFIKQ